MIPFCFRFAFFWIVFAVCIGGKNWKFPHGFQAVLSNARDYNTREISRRDHFALHALHLQH